MKRLFFLSVSLLMVVACSKGIDKRAAGNMLEWTFEATCTKASLDGSGSFSWDVGDEIAIWNATSGNFVTFVSNSGSGRFSATAPEDANFITTAYHPASIASTTTSVTLPSSYTVDALAGGDGIPMYAAVYDDTNLLRFKHLGAFLTIQIEGPSPNMSSITVSSPTPVSLSGAFDLDTIDESTAVKAANGSGSVTVTFDISDNTPDEIQFTIPVPVGDYAVMFEVKDNNDKVLMVRKTTSTVIFNRAHLYTLAKAKASVYFLETFVTSDDTINWN